MTKTIDPAQWLADSGKGMTQRDVIELMVRVLSSHPGLRNMEVRDLGGREFTITFPPDDFCESCGHSDETEQKFFVSVR